MIRVTIPVGGAHDKLILPTFGVFLGVVLRPFRSDE